MSKYGEPWKNTGTSGMVLHRESKDRAVACVNALKGVEDPAAFMAEVRAVLKGLEWADSDRDECPACYALRSYDKKHRPGCRLAALLAKMKGAAPRTGQGPGGGATSTPTP